MSMVLILLPAFVLYLAAHYWLYKKYDLHICWTGNNIETIHHIEKPMFNAMKRLLDVFLILLIIVVVIIPPITILLGISQVSNPTWGYDIEIFSGFSLDLKAISSIEATGLRNPEISGKTLISIDTSNTLAFYLYMSSQYLLAIAGVYGVSQIRLLVISLKKGNAFSLNNASIIKKVGYLVIVWNIISPIFQYFAWGYIINGISFDREGLELYPAFHFDVLAIFIGFMMIILAGLFSEAYTLEQEQRLTI